MEVIRAEVKNFGSYKELSFDFKENGLTLISGPTGSGKSTFCDIVPWILFGRTAKNGAVDEVRSWNSDESTEGTIYLDNGIGIYRSRGKSNDLYFWQDEDGQYAKEYQRGKDLADTQRMINEFIGMDADLYLSGAYFHEFSQTAQFFTASAKIRRSIVEQLVDLKLAKKLSEDSSAYKKQVKEHKEELTTSAIRLQDKVKYLSESITKEQDKADAWEQRRGEKVAAMEKQRYNFETDKAAAIKLIKTKHLERRIELEYEIAELEKEVLPDGYFLDKKASLDAREAAIGEERCSECGALKDNTKRLLITKDRYSLEREESENNQKKINITRTKSSLQAHLLTLEPAVAQENARTNVFIDQIKAMRKEANPHHQSILQTNNDLAETQQDLLSVQQELDLFSTELSDVELLQDVISMFRGVIVKNTIVELEKSTNDILNDYFDAELRVKFNITDSDKLDAEITKDGNAAVYTQLSKGQRQLLKLSFAISVMRNISLHHSVSFNSIYLDEFCEGLSEELKIKVYSLLQSLAKDYANVFVVEHSQELKNLFDNRLEISLINGESVLAEAQ